MGFFKNIIQSTKETFTDITFNDIKKRVNELDKDDFLDEAIEVLEKARELQLLEYEEDFWFFFWRKALLLYDKGMLVKNDSERKSFIQQASLNLEEAYKYATSKWQVGTILELKSKTDADPNKGGARRYYIGALGTDDEEDKAEYLKEYKTCTFFMKDFFETYKEIPADADKEDIEFAESIKFTSIPYSDRQFIFIGKDIKHLGGCFDESNNINWLFTQDYIPSDIIFPAGFPQVNTLYIANPVRTNEYLPYEGASHTLFLDKIRELRYLLQCLGATEITFECIKGHDVAMTNSISMNLEANVGVKAYKGNGGFSNNLSGKYSSNERNKVAIKQSFEPTQQPYCPENLSWLDSDNEWKTLVKQRLEGNMLNYEQVISTKSVVHMSNNQVIDVKAAFENFMVQVSGNYRQTTDSTFDENQETEWKISAVFKSLNKFVKEEKTIEFKDALSPKSAPLFTPEEDKYKKEIEYFIKEDGKISDDCRRYLERKRIKFGISVERASEIEQELLPSYTEEELEYIETYKEIVGDGEVTPRQRRMLDRERDSLGISEERCVELEKNIK